MFELQALAFQGDLTRVTSFMMGRELSGLSYPQIGIADGHHPISHNNYDMKQMEKKAKVDTYNVSLFAKLPAAPEGHARRRQQPARELAVRLRQRHERRQLAQPPEPARPARRQRRRPARAAAATFRSASSRPSARFRPCRSSTRWCRSRTSWSACSSCSASRARATARSSARATAPCRWRSRRSRDAREQASSRAGRRCGAGRRAARAGRSRKRPPSAGHLRVRAPLGRVPQRLGRRQTAAQRRRRSESRQPFRRHAAARSGRSCATPRCSS